jgi:hypothetical protein
VTGVHNDDDTVVSEFVVCGAESAQHGGISPCGSGPPCEAGVRPWQAGSLRRGEIHALIGENGAGQSTFIGIRAGVYQAGGHRV